MAFVAFCVSNSSRLRLLLCKATVRFDGMCEIQICFDVRSTGSERRLLQGRLLSHLSPQRKTSMGSRQKRHSFSLCYSRGAAVTGHEAWLGFSLQRHVYTLNPAWQLCTRKDRCRAKGKESGGVHKSLHENDGSIEGHAISGTRFGKGATLTRGRKQDGLGCLGEDACRVAQASYLGMDRPTK
jgi:hypothetical protein